MISCCNGHQVSILVLVEGLYSGDDYCARLISEDEVIELLGTIEDGLCPVCSGLIPYRRHVSEKIIETSRTCFEAVEDGYRKTETKIQYDIIPLA